MYRNFSAFLLGFGIWAVATLAFRFWGQHFFLIDDAGVLTALYVGYARP